MSRIDEPTGEIVVYQREDGAPAIDVRLDGATVRDFRTVRQIEGKQS